jgi:hypothetical protein
LKDLVSAFKRAGCAAGSRLSKFRTLLFLLWAIPECPYLHCLRTLLAGLPITVLFFLGDGYDAAFCLGVSRGHYHAPLRFV